MNDCSSNRTRKRKSVRTIIGLIVVDGLKYLINYKGLIFYLSNHTLDINESVHLHLFTMLEFYEIRDLVSKSF